MEPVRHTRSPRKGRYLIVPVLHAGHTAGHALADVHCVMRLHMTVVRMRALMCASAQSASMSAYGQHDSSAAPTDAAPDSTELLQTTAERSEVSMKRKRPLPGPGHVQEEHAKRSKHMSDSINGQSHDREQNVTSDSRTICGTLKHQTGSLQWQCQHSSQVSIASTCCASAQIAVAPCAPLPWASVSLKAETEDINIRAAGEGAAPAQASASDLPQLTITMQWSCRKPAMPEQPADALTGSRSAVLTMAAPVRQPRCQISSEPCIPESTAQELAAMAGALCSSWQHRPPGDAAAVTAHLAAILRSAIRHAILLCPWCAAEWEVQGVGASPADRPFCVCRGEPGGAPTGCPFHLRHASGSPQPAAGSGGSAGP